MPEERRLYKYGCFVRPACGSRMKQWILPIAVLAMTVMLVCGFGGGAPEESWSRKPLSPAGMVAWAELEIGAMLSPASAGAAVCNISPQKKKVRRSPAEQGRADCATAPRKRCEPQSLTYARKRSGIMRSRTGCENGPLTWFASETKLGKTSAEPVPGSVLILGGDKGHGMPTGHVAYVEEVYPEGASSYRLIFSHTNYDRKCSLETNIEARYDSSAMTLDIFSGAWKSWGRGLRVAGFIHQ